MSYPDTQTSAARDAGPFTFRHPYTMQRGGGWNIGDTGTLLRRYGEDVDVMIDGEEWTLPAADFDAATGPEQDIGELVCLVDGVNSGDGVGMDVAHPVGGREGFHIISAHDGIVPVAEVYSYGSNGSADDGPILTVSEAQALALAKMFARSPRVEAAARAAYATSCRVPCNLELADAMGALFRALEGIE